MKIGMHIFSACKQYDYKCKRAFSLLVLQDLPIHLQGLHVLYDTLMCILPVYKPTVQRADSHRLFFDIQVVTFLLGEFTLFACA